MCIEINLLNLLKINKVLVNIVNSYSFNLLKNKIIKFKYNILSY